MKENRINAEIMKAPHGACAIATMTFDDGVHSTATKLRELLAKHGLSASLMVVPTRIMAIPPYSSGYSNEDELRELCRGGYIDIQSHSYSHLYIAEETSPDYHPENCTDENRERETRGSLEWLRDHFPENKTVAFAVPGGSYDEQVKERTRECFYAIRNGRLPKGKVQSLTPREGNEHGDWARLAKVWLRECDIDEIIKHLDLCIDEGGWFISGCHNLFGQELGRGNYDITPEGLDRILAAMRERVDAGRLAVMTFGDATCYLREYEASTLEAELTGERIELELAMKETTPYGLPLSEDIFNLPLTVKVELPREWRAAELEGGGEVVLTREGGATYALFELPPRGKATLLMVQK